MIRKVQLSLNNSNTKKINYLTKIIDESLLVLNSFIDILWTKQNYNKFSSINVDTWLSARMQQCLLKQAVETIKTQRKKKKKTKPIIKKQTLNLDYRFLNFKEDLNSFDFWIRLTSIGNKIMLNLPSKKHKQFLKFKNNGWVMRKGGRLRKINDKWFLDVYMEKEEPIKKDNGESIGIDIGYKKLITCSDDKIYDVGMERIYEKIARKKQGSRSFKRVLIERNNKINESINLIDVDNIKTIVVEDLKSIKLNSSKRIFKKFNNKLQRWSYPKVLKKLQMVCEESGINFIKVEPAYTSQTCSLCGFVDQASRIGETFCCTKCGMKMDADINASKNILMRGVYNPSFNSKNSLGI